MTFSFINDRQYGGKEVSGLERHVQASVWCGVVKRSSESIISITEAPIPVVLLCVILQGLSDDLKGQIKEGIITQIHRECLLSLLLLYNKMNSHVGPDITLIISPELPRLLLAPLKT